MGQNLAMIKRVPSTPAPAPVGRPASSSAHDLLYVLGTYAANFELVVSAWKARDVYEVVDEEFNALMQLQHSAFPEAAMVMIDLVIAHNDIAVVLLDFHKVRIEKTTPRFAEQDMAARLAAHALAVDALRDFVLRKTH